PRPPYDRRGAGYPPRRIGSQDSRCVPDAGTGVNPLDGRKSSGPDKAGAAAAAQMLAKSAQQLIRQARLQRVGVGFAGADAHHVIDVNDENLAVADLINCWADLASV